MTFGEFLVIFVVFQICNLVVMNSIITICITKAIGKVREGMVEHMLYIQSLTNYSQALQDLKDKEMFDLINKKEK